MEGSADGKENNTPSKGREYKKFGKFGSNSRICSMEIKLIFSQSKIRKKVYYQSLNTSKNNQHF